MYSPKLGLFYFLGKLFMSIQVDMIVGGGNCILGLNLWRGTIHKTISPEYSLNGRHQRKVYI